MTSSLPFVSIIIPTKNAGNHLSDCLRSIDALEYPAEKREVVIVDGGSSDDTVKIARSLGANVIMGSSEGPTMARFEGVQSARGDIIAFTDSDCIVDQFWLTEGVKLLTSNIGTVVGGTVRHPPQNAFATATQVVFDIADSLKINNNSARIERRRTMTKIGSVNFITKKSTLLALTPWKWKGYGGDLVMCDLIVKNGGTLVQDPAVVVSHYKRSNPIGFTVEMFKWGNGRARMYTDKAHHMLIHDVMGFLPPILIAAAAIATLLFGMPALLYPATALAAGLSMEAVWAGVKTRSVTVAMQSPLSVLSLCIGWSAGYTTGYVRKVIGIPL